MIGGSIKYLLVLGIAGFLFVIMHKQADYTNRFLIILPWLFYVLWGMSICVVRQSFCSQSGKQVMFYLIPYVLAFTVATYVKEDREIYLDCQFGAITCVFLLWAARAVSPESQFAFILGAYFVYYFYRRRYAFCAVAFVLLYYADKRIVLLVSIACVGYIFALRIFKKDEVQKKLTLFAYGCLVLILFAYIAIIKNDTFLQVTSRYKINTMGRSNVYSLMGKFYDFSPTYMGSGIGTVIGMVKSLEYPSYQLLHNDILMFYIELGFIGFLIFWLIFGGVLKQLSKTLSADGFVLIATLLFYSFLVYTTDNISIYFNYSYSLYVIIFMVEQEMRLNNSNKDIRS